MKMINIINRNTGMKVVDNTVMVELPAKEEGAPPSNLYSISLFGVTYTIEVWDKPVA